jgi:hypothetical protein
MTPETVTAFTLGVILGAALAFAYVSPWGAWLWPR